MPGSLRLAVLLLAWLVTTRPAAALLCGSFLSPMTVSATNLAFGLYAASGTLTANTTVTIKCGIAADVLPDFHVRLSSGNAASPDARYLKQGTNRLYYNVYADPGFASIWGDGSTGSVERSYDGLLSLAISASPALAACCRASMCRAAPTATASPSRWCFDRSVTGVTGPSQSRL